MTTPNTPNPSAVIAAAQAAAAGANPATSPTTKQETPAGKSYQFPSAPTTYEFSHGVRVVVPDGVYTTSDAKEIADLDAAVRVGNIFPYTGELVSEFAKVPAPLNPNAAN